MRLTKKDRALLRNLLRVEIRLQEKTVDHIMTSPGWALSQHRQEAIDAHLRAQEELRAVLAKLKPHEEEDDREAI